MLFRGGNHKHDPNVPACKNDINQRLKTMKSLQCSIIFEIVIRNSRCFQNLHKSGAEKKYLRYNGFEIMYLQNGIAFTCCAISFKTINRLQLKSSQSGGLNVKTRGGWNRFLFLFKRLRDLSEISSGGGEVGILNLGSEMRWPIPAVGVKFANPPLDLGLKYHDPPPLV